MRVPTIVQSLVEIGGILLFGLLLGILSIGFFPVGFVVLLILLVLRETAHEITRHTTSAAGRSATRLPNPLSPCRVSPLLFLFAA
jgi:hypothetical protein